tara:strand:+ start:631 stop:1692 length:1062 start_codon:yes stop_codon:yes gene_type:complete
MREINEENWRVFQAACFKSAYEEKGNPKETGEEERGEENTHQENEDKECEETNEEKTGEEMTDNLPDGVRIARGKNQKWEVKYNKCFYDLEKGTLVAIQRPTEVNEDGFQYWMGVIELGGEYFRQTVRSDLPLFDIMNDDALWGVLTKVCASFTDFEPEHDRLCSEKLMQQVKHIEVLQKIEGTVKLDEKALSQLEQSLCTYRYRSMDGVHKNIPTEWIVGVEEAEQDLIDPQFITALVTMRLPMEFAVPEAEESEEESEEENEQEEPNGEQASRTALMYVPPQDFTNTKPAEEVQVSDPEVVFEEIDQAMFDLDENSDEDSEEASVDDLQERVDIFSSRFDLSDDEDSEFDF